MKKGSLTKKPKQQGKRNSLSSVSQISNFPQESIIIPEKPLNIQPARNEFPSPPYDHQGRGEVFHQENWPAQSSIPQMSEDIDLPDISVNPSDNKFLGYPGEPQVNSAAPEEDEDLPDISSASSAGPSFFGTNFGNSYAPFQNLQSVTSIIELPKSSDNIEQNQDEVIPHISPEENIYNRYTDQFTQTIPTDTALASSMDYSNFQPKNQSGLEEIQENAEELIEEVEEIKKEPEEIVKNKRVIIDLPLTLKCGYCECDRFESDFFPMMFGAEKEAICKMCWNATVTTTKKEKIEVLNECSTCEEWKHRYFGEKICPNNCIVCEDCQYCYIFNCKIFKKTLEESCAFCNRELIKKDQPWALVA